MATSEIAAPDLSLENLRAKYTELALKYRQLVERVDRRVAHDLVIFRLGTWGMQATSAALAVSDGERLILSNARFSSLSRLMAGPLLPIEPTTGRRYPDLKTLAVGEAAPLMQGRATTRELRYRDAGSSSVLSIRLERNHGAPQTAVLLIAEDVTEHARRDQELERTREALLHRERLRVLGELAASTAHDLGNTLRGTRFQLAMLEDESMEPKGRREAVRAIATRIEIASAVITRLHEFARTGTLIVSAVRLDRIVAGAAALMEFELREGEPVTVRSTLPQLPPVRGSIPELSLLFVNLLRNAREAMPEGGVITVSAVKGRSSVTVTVADQGMGIRPEVQGRLFEPFFTTKGARGTGLGLWLAAGTMARLGGSIRATNRPRKGAIFSLTFPLAVSRKTRSRLSAKTRGSARAAQSSPATPPTQPGPRTGSRT